MVIILNLLSISVPFLNHRISHKWVLDKTYFKVIFKTFCVTGPMGATGVPPYRRKLIIQTTIRQGSSSRLTIWMLSRTTDWLQAPGYLCSFINKHCKNLKPETSVIFFLITDCILFYSNKEDIFQVQNVKEISIKHWTSLNRFESAHKSCEQLKQKYTEQVDMSADKALQWFWKTQHILKGLSCFQNITINIEFIRFALI